MFGHAREDRWPVEEDGEYGGDVLPGLDQCIIGRIAGPEIEPTFLVAAAKKVMRVEHFGRRFAADEREVRLFGPVYDDQSGLPGGCGIDAEEIDAPGGFR